MKRIICLLLVNMILVVSMFSENSRFYIENKGISKMYIDSETGLRVRDEPSLDSKKIALLPDNLVVNVIEIGAETVIDGIHAPWVKIKMPGYEISSSKKTSGWVFGGYLKRANNHPDKKDNDYYWKRIRKLSCEMIKSKFKVYDDESIYPANESFEEFIKNHSPANTIKIPVRDRENPEGESFLVKYIYEDNGVKVEARDVDTGTDKSGNRTYTRNFTGIAINRNFNNSFGIRMGMNLEELKSVLGNCMKNMDENKFYASFDEFHDVFFTFDGNGLLTEIYKTSDGGLGN